MRADEGDFEAAEEERGGTIGLKAGGGRDNFEGAAGEAVAAAADGAIEGGFESDTSETTLYFNDF